MELDKIDKRILNLIQTAFPVTSFPYDDIGKEIGISADEAFERTKRLQSSGTIRRIGASFDSRSLGWTSTLCAIATSSDKIEMVAKVISSFEYVTHNYERNNHYNLWFTLIAPNEEKVAQIIKSIEDQTGEGPVRNMPMIKKFKIKVDFQFKEDEQPIAGSNGN
ncbi:MAG: AsnC family transcriptional regulator [Nitrospinota bacterium]